MGIKAGDSSKTSVKFYHTHGLSLPIVLISVKVVFLYVNICIDSNSTELVCRNLCRYT